MLTPRPCAAVREAEKRRAALAKELEIEQEATRKAVARAAEAEARAAEALARADKAEKGREKAYLDAVNDVNQARDKQSRAEYERHRRGLSVRSCRLDTVVEEPTSPAAAVVKARTADAEVAVPSVDTPVAVATDASLIGPSQARARLAAHHAPMCTDACRPAAEDDREGGEATRSARTPAGPPAVAMKRGLGSRCQRAGRLAGWRGRAVPPVCPVTPAPTSHCIPFPPAAPAPPPHRFACRARAGDLPHDTR